MFSDACALSVIPLPCAGSVLSVTGFLFRCIGFFFSAAEDSVSVGALCEPFATHLMLPPCRAGANHLAVSGQNENHLPVPLVCEGRRFGFRGEGAAESASRDCTFSSIVLGA